MHWNQWEKVLLHQQLQEDQINAGECFQLLEKDETACGEHLTLRGSQTSLKCEVSPSLTASFLDAPFTWVTVLPVHRTHRLRDGSRAADLHPKCF